MMRRGYLGLQQWPRAHLAKDKRLPSVQKDAALNRSASHAPQAVTGSFSCVCAVPEKVFMLKCASSVALSDLVATVLLLVLPHAPFSPVANKFPGGRPPGGAVWCGVRVQRLSLYPYLFCGAAGKSA